jgi:hypothetical protein
VYRCQKTGYGVNLYGMGVLKDLLSKSDLLEALWEEPKDVLRTLDLS